MNWEPNQVYLDIPLALAYGEILVSAELKQSVWELRLTGLRRLQAQLTHYERLGYNSSLLEAISEKKSRWFCRFLPRLSLTR